MKISTKAIPVVALLLVISILMAACSESKVAVLPTTTIQVTPPPGVFKIESLAVNPSEINAGVPTLVTAKVNNTGAVDESYQGSIRIEDSTASALPTFMGSDIVTIPAGKTQLLSVPLTLRNPGNYRVAWDGVSQDLKVNPQDVSSPAQAAVGPVTAPDFTAVDVVTGKKISLSQYKGKPVLLNFVNYGCNPQTNQVVGAELMGIKQLQSQRSDFIPVSVFCGCCPPEVLKQFAKENNLNWPWILDSDYSITRGYAGYLRQYGYPTLVFVDKDQLIVDTAGYLNPAALNTKLDNLTSGGVKN
jgi:peroxiredoxin